MKIKYLGTAAAEGIPALFCHCENCIKARKNGGKDIRTRSQAIVDDRILIDWPSDAYMHMILHKIDYAEINTLLITHTHEDHFYPDDWGNRRPNFSHIDGCSQLNLYGSEDIKPAFDEMVGLRQERLEEDNINRINLHVVKPFEPFVSEGYTITALKAVHGTNNPYIYMIQKDGKSMLYAHDTDIFHEETWEYLKSTGVCFNLVSLDCTEGEKHITYTGHMCIERNVIVKDKMIELGMADESTVFIVNHFSHNGKNVLYRDMKKTAAKHGLIGSYDGMEVEF